MTEILDMSGSSDQETELLSAKEGEALAREWQAKPNDLEMSNTLLSSQDIIRVVKATGLVAPFYIGGGDKARLKKAAYEGRIGTRAYKYDKLTSPQRCFDSESDAFLLVPKNSIVFVECDLDFRLPDFIALRFNLQIQHVHRGLLLGTGPLIDPGFWGKLCIPLHNLTDEDYAIPKNEGLIWIEFTKTTLPTGSTDPARAPLSSGKPGIRGKWNIEEFLNKAAGQYYGHKVPIRSSLPTMFDEATRAVTKSAEQAEAAAKSAEGLRSLNTFAMMAAAIALVALVITAIGFLMNLSSRNEEIAGKLRSDTEASQRAIEEHITDVDRFGTQPAEARAALPGLHRQLARERREIDELRKQIAQLQARLDLMNRNDLLLKGQYPR